MKMRLRNRNIPQAGTGAKSNGESRPGPPGPGSPSYSGGGTVSHTSVQSSTAAENINLTTSNPCSYPTSPTSSISLFPSPDSSPKSYMLDNNSSSSRSTTLSPMSDDVTREATATHPVPIPDNITSTSLSQNNVHSVGHNTRQSPLINTPARSVLQDMLPATTLAGKCRQRMKWTDQIKKELLRCYYIVTECESNLTAFRPQLHQKFIESFPELSHISEQRLSDQIRVIHRNNRIASHVRNEIKQSIANLTQNANNSNVRNSVQNTHLNSTSPCNMQTDHDYHNQSNLDIVPSPHHSPVIHQSNTLSNYLNASEHTILPETIASNTDPNPIETQKIENVFNEMLIKYTDTDPLLRPILPKLQVTRNIIKTVNVINKIIGTYLEEKDTPNIEEIQSAIYCAAATATTLHTKLNNQHKNVSDKREQHNIPKWQVRILNRIKQLRKEIGRLTQYLKGNLNTRNKQKLNPKNYTTNQLEDQLDNLKQKLQAQSKRLRRLKISNERRKHNILFSNNQKVFYQNLNAENIKITQSPNIEEVKGYWESIWSQPVQHNTQTPWIDDEIQECQNISLMPDIIIDREDVTNAIKRTLNWKAPGPDKIHNYWIKYFTVTHSYIANIFNSFLQNPHTIPSFLTQGITYLKPKDNDTTNPTKYRPITCLPTLYKLLTSIITQKLNTHIIQNKIIPEEQKGCAKGSMGCKEQLIIDAAIHKQAKQDRKNLHYSYIDYKKAFDSVPHSWLIHVLKIYNVNSKLIELLEHMMSNWSTTLNLRTVNTNLCTTSIQIKRGIFQGDSLSPLWFCLAINPLSKILNKSGHGYTINKQNNTKITHLLYMDDIKLYANNRQQLENLLKVTEKFSTDIKMTFGIDKCKINCIQKGQHTQTEPLNLELQEGIIDSMQEKDTYKYLGYMQSTVINHKEIKNTLKSKYKQRLNKILNTQLSGRNKIKAINTYAVPILTYSFGIIKWTNTELENLNITTRRLSYKHKIHHIHSAVERFTLKRKLGGRGVIDIKNLHYSQIDKLRTYFLNKAETSQLHKAIVNLPHKNTPLQLHNNLFDPKQKILTDIDKIQKWKSKALHGKYPHYLEQEHVDKVASCSWLSKGNIYSETEGFLIAIQDQIIKTRNYSKYILKETIATDKCRLCNQTTKTIDHITGGCNSLANKEYTHRHDNVAKHIHQLLAIKYKLIDTHTPYYKYKPRNVLENSTVKLYWDRDIITDRTILSNRPDITLTIKADKITFLIDIAVPNTNNLKQKHNEKIQKYIPLADEIKQMWHQRTVKIIPIIISSTGVIPKSLDTALKTINLHKNTYLQLQKSIVIDTCSIVRRFLNPSSSFTPPESSLSSHST